MRTQSHGSKVLRKYYDGWVAWNTIRILGEDILTEQNVKVKGIDLEWLQLIMEAKNLGLQKEEIREFLHNNRAKEVLIEA